MGAEQAFRRNPVPYLRRALTHIDGLAAAPSVIVASGGGYHCYWLLREPFVLASDEDRERARRLQAAWVACVGGDGGAKDLARVLRVPGTCNLKYDPPLLVAFVRADYNRLYTLPDLEALAAAGRQGRRRGGDLLPLSRVSRSPHHPRSDALRLGEGAAWTPAPRPRGWLRDVDRDRHGPL